MTAKTDTQLELRFERHQALRSCLEGIACLPESCWHEYAMKIPKQCPYHRFSSDDIELGLRAYWCYMHAQRCRYGRAIEPTKEVFDDLAPIVGVIAIELRSMNIPKELWQTLSLENARDFLGRYVTASIGAGDPSMLVKIAKFADADLASHVNFLVWEAFWCCMADKPEHLMINNFGDEFVYREFPKTKEIKDFVNANDHPMWFALRSLDDPGWAKVFKQSGVRKIIQSSTKSKNPTA